ncbi:hypothetical protein P389DRAFT_166220 [Cystobasidium minutum MCA 4210]|uniref:uncharacterized protein n=1 Tax=Cystobasidium minutum MCA 4210 TaxID=1397322 RepID=UPI0034CF85DF|eukprot:jgi/Rhomi1/166220/fgenesh1_kg.1_\
MNDKRRVLASTTVSNNDTPTRGIRASPTVNVGGSAGSGVARVRAINNTGLNNSSNGTGSGSSATTPTARSGTPLASSSSRQTPGNTLSPAAGAAIRARARVLGYDHQQEVNPSSSSPLASSSRFNGPATPSSSTHNGPVTPSSAGYTPVSTSGSSTTPSTSAARAQVSTTGPSRPTPTSHLLSSSGISATRKVRAASTPPVDDSPTVSRPVSPSRRRAFPAFPSTENADSPQPRSSSPSSSLGAPKMPRVRPISGVRSNTTGNAGGLLSSSRGGADPVKPPLHHSKSMTTRPPSAASNALLPSPTIRAPPSGIFPSSSSSAVSAQTARARVSPNLGSGQSPSPSTPAAASSRPLSPVRVRPPSPVRPASPRRGEAFRPTSALSTTLPARLDNNTFSKVIPVAPSPPIPSGISTSKRPSTSSQSSSSHSVATTADTSSTTTTTAATSFTSPDQKILSDLSTSPNINAQTSSSSGMNGYHRARRRSHSTNSSISSTSNLSSNVSKTKVLSSASTSGTTKRHSRSGSASSNAVLGMGINIPQVTSPTGGSANIAFSTSPIMRGSLASPHRQTPLSPGKGFFSEAEKMEQQAHLDAKVHRKILDLEITNTSLLAINASLEKAKAKQSAELRELRRRIHDRSSFAPLSSSPGSLLSPSSAEAGGDISWNAENEEEDKEMAWEDILKEDTRFADMVKLLETMTRRGKKALEKIAAVSDKPVKSGPKVLNHFEIPADESIEMDRRLSGKHHQNLMRSTMTNRTGTTEDNSTIEADSGDDDDEDDATTDPSGIDTSNTAESQNESSEALSSFECTVSCSIDRLLTASRGSCLLRLAIPRGHDMRTDIRPCEDWAQCSRIEPSPLDCLYDHLSQLARLFEDLECLSCADVVALVRC